MADNGLLVKNYPLTHLDSPQNQYSPALQGSLAAWTLTHNSAPVKQLAEELRQGLSLGAQPLSFARQFLARCYDGLFRGEFPKVTVNPSLSPFPPQGGIAATREILAPAQILTEHRADPLEAALLVSALSQEYLVKNRGVNLVLFAVSDTEALPHIFLAWHVGLRNWHALDMSSISEMDFDANFSSATEELKKLLTKRPDISKDLEHDGVFFRRDQSVVALDLGRAASEFGIKSLP